MSQYDSPFSFLYQFPAINFVSGAGASKIPVPRGAKQARVLDLQITATTTFTQTTTPGLVQIGDGTTANKFAQLSAGATAAGSTITGNDTGGVFLSEYIAQNYNSGAGLHDLTMTVVAPTGGSPAGVGTINVIMAWDMITR